MKFLFITEITVGFGFGNFARCKALAEELRPMHSSELLVRVDVSSGIKINEQFPGPVNEWSGNPSEILRKIVLQNSVSSYTHLVLDLFGGDYYLNPNKITELYKEIRKHFNGKIISVDDQRISNWEFPISDLSVISNADVGDNRVGRMLLGPPFQILSRELIEAKKKGISSEKKYHFYISFGGSDLGLDTLKILTAITLFSGIGKITARVILGPLFSKDYCEKIISICNIHGYSYSYFNKDYVHHMQLSKYVICAEGNTKIEASALGVPAFVISQYDHDSIQLKNYLSINSSIYLGKSEEFNGKSFQKIVLNINSDYYNEMAFNGFNSYDGSGPRRIANRIMEL